MNQINDFQLGDATLSPKKPIIAGEIGTWTIVYTVGRYGLDNGGVIKLAWRWVSDWEVPQFDQPQAQGYTTVVTNGRAKVRASWHERGYIRPKSICMLIEIYDGVLAPGETVTITLGDTAQGSPGIRAQTYIESEFELFVIVDPTNSTNPQPIADRLVTSIVAADIAELVCILPSQAIVNRPVDIFIKGEDHWRNPTPPPENVTFEWVGTGQVEINDQQLVARTAASGYLIAKNSAFKCKSNPITVLPDERPFKRYWGDLHAQTAETTGIGSEDEYFTFGRDIARLDFTSHQGNDFQMNDAYWQHLNDTVRRYHEDGKFVVFPGYEWSGTTSVGGDHNVFYRQEGRPILRSSHWLIPDTPPSELSPALPATDFYNKLKQAVPLEDVLVCQHVGGRYANTREYFDQELISLVEVVSTWGVFEWILWDAFDQGHIVGVMANSDGHHGRPGAEGAGMADFGIVNGLTCVLAESLTRDAIFDALKNRRCYGTTGPRILLDFSINGRPMGTILPKQDNALHIKANVTGTAPLEALQLFCGKEIVSEVRSPEFDNLTRSNRIRISWAGSRERGPGRRVTWDGTVSVEGCEIISAETFSFDVISDSISSQSPTQIVFSSKTTGDRDGLDIVLTDASSGTITFQSEVGKMTVNLADLTDTNPRIQVAFGGVGIQGVIERYPAEVTTRSLNLNKTVLPEAGKQTAYFVKAIQVDGNMAWASPIYCKSNP